MAVRLVIGLGNPGRKYAKTRHNVGFEMLDELAAELGFAFENSTKLEAQVAKGPDLVLAKPQTYMNLSGNAASRVCQFYKIAPEEVLVVYDDLDLPLAKLRIRQKGSAGGHNGMKSIIQSLGTDAIARMRVGIGRAPGAMGQGSIGYVLGKFRGEERSELEKSIKRAVLAVRHTLDHGIESAMNEFNRSDEPPAKAPQPDAQQQEEAP